MICPVSSVAEGLYIAKPKDKNMQKKEQESKASIDIPYIRQEGQPLSRSSRLPGGNTRSYDRWEQAYEIARAHPEDKAAQRRATLLAHAAKAGLSAQARVDAFQAQQAAQGITASTDQEEKASADSVSSPPNTKKGDSTVRRIYTVPSKTPSMPPSLFDTRN